MPLDRPDTTNNVTVLRTSNRFNGLLGVTLLLALQAVHAGVPTASIVVADSILAIGETSQVTFTFSEAVTDFDATDLAHTGASLGAMSTADGGITWTAVLTPFANSTSSGNVVTVQLSGVTSVSTSDAGVGTATSNAYVVDTMRPTASIAVSDTALALGETSLVTISFSEAVTGLTLADFTVANGSLSGLSTPDNTVYTATFTPATNVTQAANVITLNHAGIQDGAGNIGTGTTSSNNFAIDTFRPTATVTISDTEVNADETATVTIAFSEAVTGLDLADLSADNGALSGLSTSDNVTYTAQFTPTPNLPFTPTNRIRLDATAVQDAAGNNGTGFVDSNDYSVRTERLDLLVTSSSDSADDATIAADLSADAADGDGLSLREAIAWARNRDTVAFDLDGGVSGHQGGMITLGGTELNVLYNISLNGDVDGDHAPDVTISGNDISRIFKVASSVTLEGLSLVNGRTGGGGAAVGVAVGGVALTVRDCIIDGNRELGGGGGGIYASGSVVTLINTTVSNNSSNTFGGGVRVAGVGGSLNVINSTITGNRTTVTGAHGGGIQFGGSSPMTIVNSTISGNAALGASSLGGGIRVTADPSTAFIYNSSIVGNASTGSGGGVNASGGETILNSVVAGNVSGAGSQPALGGSALASGGSPDDVGGVVEVAAHSYFGSNVTIASDDGSLNNQGTGDLLLADLAFNGGGHVQTHEPQIGSALIDAGSVAHLPSDAYDLDSDGNTAESLPTDANGSARLRAALDIGAVELTSAAVKSVTSSAPNGSYYIGATIAVTVTFDSPVIVDTTGGTPTLTLETGATDRVIAYVSGSGTDTLNFIYVVQPHDQSADLDYSSSSALSLNGAIMRDLDGLDATLTLPTSGSTRSLAGQKAIAVIGQPATDVDGDGMSNDFEQQYGLDPQDPADAATDLDRDGVSNLDEFVGGSDPTRDDHPPMLSSPAPVTIDATGLLTAAPTLSPPAAVDGHDGPLAATLVDGPDYLAPGTHIVTWRAVDAAGNRAETLQAINIRPLISLAADQVSGEGTDVSLRFFLNGIAPSYPLTIAYTVGGTAGAGDHDLASGTVTFQQDEIERSVTVHIASDGIAEGEETITVALAGDGNFGAHREHVIEIVETNVAPSFDWSVAQGGAQTSAVVHGGGLVTLAASVRDANPADLHTYQWTIPAGVTATNVGDAARTFDPSLVAPGIYKFELTATDNGAPASSTRDSRVIEVIAAAPTLSAVADTDDDGIDDAAEGWVDDDGDGQPNYLDGSELPNVLSERTEGDAGLFMLEAQPGIVSVLGERAFEAGADGALVSDAEVRADHRIPADTIENIGGYFDFKLRQLPIPGGSFEVVLAQRRPVPANAVYRQFVRGSWATFVEDARNQLASAPGAMGVCPPPGSTAYRAGLSEGDWCVQATIEDGGANDADGIDNAAVSNLGGVGAVNVVSSTTRGGGGSMALWFLASLLILALSGARHRKANAHALVAAVAVCFALLPFQSRADSGSWSRPLYVVGALGHADSNISRADLQRSFAEHGIAGTVRSVDAERSAWSLGLGYRLHSRWSLEANYLDLGEVALSFSAPINAADLARVHPSSGEGGSLSVLYQHPLTERFGVRARVGALHWKAEYQTTRIGAVADTYDASGTDFLWGVGAGYAPSRAWLVAVELQRIEFEGRPTDFVGLQIQWGRAD